MYYQKVYQAIAVTPVTISEILWGELLWCATRAMLPIIAILLIGCAIGDFSVAGSFLVLPVALIGAFLFGAMGMLAAAVSKTIESLSYPQYLIIFPMFLFCGVYFPIGNLPDWIRGFAWCLPLTSILSLARTLTLGFAWEWWSLPILLVWTVVLTYFGR